jgi:predicted flap endonuclease-1-like 5' DNA nuclease
MHAGLRDNASSVPVRSPAGRQPPPRARSIRPPPTNALSILAVLVVVIVALAIGYAVGRRQRMRGADTVAILRDTPPPAAAPTPPVAPLPTSEPQVATPGEASDGAIAERARVIRSFEAETAMLRRILVTRDASVMHLSDLAEDRRRIYGELAATRGETARYRQLVVDLENNAPPPFFGAGAPDDLKLIVGVGPVLERMLQQLGITTYRQIARWSERDIDEFDAKLPEFPGRIRRDAWVTQARALHASKFGAPPSARDR